MERYRWISGKRLRTVSAELTLAVAVVSAIFLTPPIQAQTFSILHAFDRKKDGGNPQADLLWKPGGGLYGTDFLGGDPSCSCGVVFKLFPNGALTVLQVFKGSDGANPAAGLISDGKGNLYGTTSQGGAGQSPHGTVYKLSPPATSGAPWIETILHTFRGESDGANPYGTLIRDHSGNLFGTTYGGGSFEAGAVFKLDPTGKETVLYSFKASPDGAHPYGGLVEGRTGNLYGTTVGGGASNHGTLFELDATGKEMVLYNFTGQADGAYPNASLTLDAAGNLYGTANGGGDAESHGTVFKLDKTDIFSVIHTFSGGGGGSSPNSRLILDASGSLYGTTNEGGDGDYDGTVFKLDPKGRFTVLHIFSGGGGGAYPYAGLALDNAGNLYGTTVNVGVNGNGVAFKLTPK